MLRQIRSDMEGKIKSASNLHLTIFAYDYFIDLITRLVDGWQSSCAHTLDSIATWQVALIGIEQFVSLGKITRHLIQPLADCVNLTKEYPLIDSSKSYVLNRFGRAEFSNNS